MAIPTNITDLSTTAATNSPAGSDAIGTSADDYLRVIQAMLKESGQTLYVAAGADTITFATVPTFAAYASGQRFWVKAAGANTGAATLNLNGLGAKNILKNGATALVAGDIPAANAVFLVIYDGTQFQLASPGVPNFSSPVSFAAGAVGAPSIYLSTDTTTGLYRIGANNVGYAVSGAKVLDISSAGLAVTGTVTYSGALSTTLSTASAATAVLARQVSDPNFQLTAQNGPAGGSGTEVFRFGNNYSGTGWDSYFGFIRGGGPQNGKLQVTAGSTLVGEFTGTGLTITGTLTSSSVVGLNGQATNSIVGLAVKSANSTSGTYSFIAYDSASSDIIQARGDGRVQLGLSSTVVITTGVVAITGDISVSTKTPASAAAAGVAGTITWDANYIYVCTAANTWKRVAIATW